MVIKERLNRRIAGLSIERADVLKPIVVRDPAGDFESSLQTRTIQSVDRRGKYLIISVDGGLKLVFHMMLWGRFRLHEPSAKLLKTTVLRLLFSNGTDLRYLDKKLMGKVYMVRGDHFSSVPGFLELGPEANDPQLTQKDFLKRLRRHRGIIKNVLRNQRFVSGLGSAYADEILFDARILPSRKRSTLTDEEMQRLYSSTKEVLGNAIREIDSRAKDNIHEEIRDFLKVHRKGGQPCPRCGSPISELKANRELTDFCRKCQR